jgi:uncharacterized RDD family membrane protein YckC
MRTRLARRADYDPTCLERRLELKGSPFASFRRRALAFALDFGIVVLMLILISLPRELEIAGKTANFDMDIDPFHGWALLSLPAYFGLWTYFGRGQTPGKWLLGIRVLSLTHHRLGLWHSVERALGYGASILEGGFGFFQYFIHPNRQTVHDRIAETIVVRLERRGRGKDRTGARAASLPELATAETPTEATAEVDAEATPDSPDA